MQTDKWVFRIVIAIWITVALCSIAAWTVAYGVIFHFIRKFW